MFYKNVIYLSFTFLLSLFPITYQFDIIPISSSFQSKPARLLHDHHHKTSYNNNLLKQKNDVARGTIIWRRSKCLLLLQHRQTSRRYCNDNHPLMLLKATTTTTTEEEDDDHTAISAAADDDDDNIVITAEGLDLQSDLSKYGRGDMHLSASLNEGDVVAYQIGRWFVDGVEVGDDDEEEEAKICYGCVDNIQLVWTHNCEHGVIRCLPMKKEKRDDKDDDKSKKQNMITKLIMCNDDDDDDDTNNDDLCEFGPDQLVARFPVSWNEEMNEVSVLVPIDEESLFQKII